MASRLFSQKMIPVFKLSAMEICLPTVAKSRCEAIREKMVRNMATAASQESRQKDDAIVESRKNEVSGSRKGRSRDTALSVAPLGIFDLWDPFTTTSRSLRQMMETMDRLVDDAIPTPSSSLLERIFRSGKRTPWDVVEKKDAYLLRVDMPGIGKEHLKVFVEDNELVIQGEYKSNDEGEAADRIYSMYNTRVTLPDDAKVDEIKAELRDGVLNVVIPKSEKPERKVLDVQIS